MQSLAGAQDIGLRGAIGEGGLDRVEDLGHSVERPVAAGIAMRQGLAVEAEQDVVEPEAGPVGGRAGDKGENGGAGIETEGAGEPGVPTPSQKVSFS